MARLFQLLLRAVGRIAPRLFRALTGWIGVVVQLVIGVVWTGCKRWWTAFVPVGLRFFADVTSGGIKLIGLRVFWFGIIFAVVTGYFVYGFTNIFQPVISAGFNNLQFLRDLYSWASGWDPTGLFQFIYYLAALDQLILGFRLFAYVIIGVVAYRFYRAVLFHVMQWSVIRMG